MVTLVLVGERYPVGNGIRPAVRKGDLAGELPG